MNITFASEPDDGFSPSEETLALQWQRCNSECGSEKDCVEDLYQTAAAMALVKCRGCGSDNLARNYGARVATCLQCKKRTWLTSGTFFDRARKIRPWRIAFWFLEEGININANQFHKFVGVSYDTAHKIFKKIAWVVESNMNEGGLVPSSSFLSVFGKRSLETPIRSQPKAEQEQFEKEQLEGCPSYESSPPESAASDTTAPQSFISMLDSQQSLPSPMLGSTPELPPQLNQEEEHLDFSIPPNTVCDLLTAQPILFDDLRQRSGMQTSELSSVLTLLELSGFATRMAGDRYVRNIEKLNMNQEGDLKTQRPHNNVQVSDQALVCIRDIKYFIETVFNKISRKYLQLYLAIYWCNRDRVRWNIGSIAAACCRFGVLRYAQIRDYVTPLDVRIFHANKSQSGFFVSSQPRLNVLLY